MSEDREMQKYIEDDFDLEKFKREAVIIKEENFRKKYRIFLDFISLIILLLAFASAYFLYGILNYCLSRILN